MVRIRSILMAAVSAVALFGTAPARAEYPDRPIRIIIPYQAGGGTDVMTRVIIEKLRERIKQPIVVETKPGAYTVIGTKLLLASPPDGYTLMMTSSATFTTTPFIVRNPGYDPLESFSLISYVAYTPVVLVVNAGVKAKTLAEFIAEAKAEPNRISYASYGRQLNAELFQKRAGIRLTNVQYKGVDAVHAVVAGQVDAMFDGVFTALPHIRGGRTRALALMQSERTRFAPEIPTVQELGMDIPDLSIWYGLVGPKGMDPTIVATLAEEFRIALQSPEVREKLGTFNVETVGDGPESLRSKIVGEYAEHKKIVQELGIKAE